MRSASAAERIILRGAQATALGFVIRFGARLLFLLVAARLFGVALFGAYSLGVAAVELAVTLGALGSKRILFKRLEDEAAERPAMHVVLDSAIMVAGISLALGAGLALAGAAAPERLISPNFAAALVFLAPMIAGQALLDLLLAATRWTQKIRYETLSRSILEPYGAVAAALVAYTLGFRQGGLLISYWAGTLAALAYALYGARASLGPFKFGAYRFAPRGVGHLLRASAVATVSDMLNGLFFRVDLYLVGLFLGEGPAGIYAMARQIRTPIRQVRQSFDSLLNPIIARTLTLRGATETAAGVASVARLILALQLPILIALALAGAPLLAWFGPEFVAGYWALLLLAAAETIQGAFGVSDLILLYRRPMAQLGITSANILFNLLVGVVLIRPLGVTGAGLSVLAGVAAGALIRRGALRTHFGFGVPLHYSAGPLGAAILAAAAAYGLSLALSPMPEMLAYGLRLLVGIGIYYVLLRLWLALSGESLSLVNLQAAAES